MPDNVETGLAESKPIRLGLAGCCALAASGHAADALSPWPCADSQGTVLKATEISFRFATTSDAKRSQLNLVSACAQLTERPFCCVD